MFNINYNFFAHYKLVNMDKVKIPIRHWHIFEAYDREYFTFAFHVHDSTISRETM